MKIALIGLGGISEKGYLPVVTAMEGVELCFCSRTAEKVDRYQRMYRVQKGANNLEDVLRWQPDAVFVLTPGPTHFEIATKFLNEGVDVYLEKPATFRSEDTRRLAELADEKKRILMVGFNRRFSPLVLKTKQLWGDRAVEMAYFEKHRSQPNNPDLFTHLIDEFIHVIDLVRFLCGEVQVENTLSMKRDGRLVRGIALLKLEKGGFATASTCMRAGHWQERYALHGDEASLVLDMFSQIRMNSNGKEEIWTEPYDSTWRSTLKGRGFVDEIEHFLDCVRTRKRPLTDAWDSLKTQLLAEAIADKDNREHRQ